LTSLATVLELDMLEPTAKFHSVLRLEDVVLEFVLDPTLATVLAQDLKEPTVAFPSVT